jgi:N-methylhydantoinase A
VRGIGRVPPVKLKTYKPSGMKLKDALRETRRARFAGVTLDCPVYQREQLDVGIRLPGPAIIDQLDATTVIPSGQTARVDEFKSLLITIGAA